MLFWQSQGLCKNIVKMSETLSKWLQLLWSPREHLGHCFACGKSLWSIPGSHTLLILSCQKYPGCFGPWGRLNTRGDLPQIHILLLKAVWMQWHRTSSGWLESSPQKYLRSCESPQASYPALFCMPISKSEQPQSLLVPAWPATNQASCTSVIPCEISEHCACSEGTPEDIRLSSECFGKSSFMWETPLDIFKVYSTHHTGGLARRIFQPDPGRKDSSWPKK